MQRRGSVRRRSSCRRKRRKSFTENAKIDEKLHEANFVPETSYKGYIENNSSNGNKLIRIFQFVIQMPQHGGEEH